MIGLEKKNGAELADALMEIKRLRASEQVKVAEYMGKVSVLLDNEIRDLRRKEREGEALMADGITLDRLDEILRRMGEERESV